jgi:hypothetical protein
VAHAPVASFLLSRQDMPRLLLVPITLVAKGTSMRHDTSLRRTSPLALLLGSLLAAHGCAAVDDREGFSDKEDSIEGKQVQLRYNEATISWYEYGASANLNSVDVLLRADDKLVVRGTRWRLGRNDLAYDGAECSDDEDCQTGEICYLNAGRCSVPQYSPTSILSVGVDSEDPDVPMGFVLWAGPWWSQESLVTCGPEAGEQAFSSVDIDFAAQEITADGSRTYAFADCGIDLDPADIGLFDTWGLQVFALPLATLSGADFTGTYDYELVVRTVD